MRIIFWTEHVLFKSNNKQDTSDKWDVHQVLWLASHALTHIQAYFDSIISNAATWPQASENLKHRNVKNSATIFWVFTCG